MVHVLPQSIHYVRMKQILDMKSIPESIEMETVKKCPVCAHTSFSTIADRGIIEKAGEPYAMTNVICARCSCVFLNPRPTEKGYEEFYRTLYVSDRGESKKEGEEIVMKKDTTKKTGSIALALEPHIKQGARILVIGGGLGMASAHVRDYFEADVEMIEPSQEQAEHARRSYKLEVHNMDWETFTQTHKEKTYDAIVMHHVLEHFPHPVVMLTQARNYLAKNGVFYIEVPDVNDYKKPKAHFYDLLHPISFSPSSMFWCLHYAGLKAIWHNQNKRTRLQIIVQKAEDAQQKVNALNAKSWSTIETITYGMYRSLYDTAYNMKHVLKTQNSKLKTNP